MLSIYAKIYSAYSAYPVDDSVRVRVESWLQVFPSLPRSGPLAIVNSDTLQRWRRCRQTYLVECLGYATLLKVGSAVLKPILLGRTVFNVVR
jgi:hypothetical protein